MYETFMGLSQRPFVASPDVTMYVRTEVHEKALRQLMFGMNANRGISLMTGAEGTGKSILAQKLIQNLAKQTIPLYFPNAHFATRRDFYQTILFELRQPYAGLGLQELRLQLTSVMRQMAPRHRPILLVIDEAHDLSDRILEEVRNCLNFVVEGDCIFRTLLVGHPQLEERLADPDLAAVNNRIGMHAMLGHLTRSQSVQYITQRLNLAHGKAESIFETEAIFAIAEAADGLPRAINQLCDHALMLATARGIRPVDVDTVLDSLEELQTLPLHWRTPSIQRKRADEELAIGLKSARPSFEEFRQNESNQSAASIEVGSAWDDLETLNESMIDVESNLLEDDGNDGEFDEILEEHLDAGFDFSEEDFAHNECMQDGCMQDGCIQDHCTRDDCVDAESAEEDFDPVLDARLSRLSDEEIQQDALAEVSLLNDVLNVQLKDDREETSAERRIFARPVDIHREENHLHHAAVDNAEATDHTEVVMDRYALIDAGLVERVREWERKAQQRAALSQRDPEDDIYPLLEESEALHQAAAFNAATRQNVALGSISLETTNESEQDVTPDALRQLRDHLPAGHVPFKLSRPKSA